MPIGNLNGQFFANVCLDLLDQYVKHKLRARYYVQYADDMVLVAREREQLLVWRGRVEPFLNERLELELNSKERLRPVRDGIDFLGYVVRPSYLLVRRRVVGAFRERLLTAERALQDAGLTIDPASRSVYPCPWPELIDLRQSLSAHLAHLDKASSWRLVESLKRRFPWLGEYFCQQGSKVSFVYPTPSRALRYCDQVGHFARRLPGHVLLVEIGYFVEVIPSQDHGGRSYWIHRRGFEGLRRRLWNDDTPVEWIDQTGRRIARVNERSLVCWWGHQGFAGAAGH